jgi:hypothetical protein
MLARTNISESMSSVPLYDEIVSGLAISRRLSINPHTEPICPAATTQVYPAATLLQASDARSEVVTFGTQRGELTLRREQPPFTEHRESGAK